MSGLVGVWPAHLLDFCHPVLRINAGDSLLLSKSLALLDLISEDWSSILQLQCVFPSLNLMIRLQSWLAQ
jgi:hypothetical protein